MPYRHLPNTDSQRLTALDAAYQKWIGTAAGERLLTDGHFDALDLTKPASLHSTFRRDVGESSAALAQQAAQTTTSDTTHSALAQVVSHFIQVFNFGVARTIFPRTDRAFYGLEINQSDLPPLSSQADIQFWAGKVIDGETARLAADPGATPMAMPTAAEVAAARTATTIAKQTQTAAKDAYDKEQGDVSAARPAIDLLIADIWDTIEFKLRTLDGPSRRRRAREWGVVYLTRPGEPEDPETENGNEGANGNPPPASPNPTP